MLRRVQDTKYAATEFKPTGVGPGVLKVYIGSGWAQGATSRKFTLEVAAFIFSRARRCGIRGRDLCDMRWAEGSDSHLGGDGFVSDGVAGDGQLRRQQLCHM